MSDIIDKVMNVGADLEGKVREFLKELESKCSGDDAEPLDSVKKLENRVVEDGVKAIKELIFLLKEGKDKVGSEASGAADAVARRLNLASLSELEVVKEMARVAREKVDELEKRLNKVEGK